METLENEDLDQENAPNPTHKKKLWVDIGLCSLVILIYSIFFGNQKGNLAGYIFLILLGLSILLIYFRHAIRKGILTGTNVKYIIIAAVILIPTILWMQSSGKIYGRYDHETASKEENAYIELYENGHIRLHVDMGVSSGWPVVDRQGNYTFDKKASKLNIKFYDGQGPYQLPMKAQAGNWSINNDGTIFEQNEKSRSWAEYKNSK